MLDIVKQEPFFRTYREQYTVRAKIMITFMQLVTNLGLVLDLNFPDPVGE